MTSHQATGNIGMYYVAYRLSRMGWNVMPTSRNARGIDLLAYDANVTIKLGIQIKTLSEDHAVPLGTKPFGQSAGRLVGHCYQSRNPATGKFHHYPERG